MMLHACGLADGDGRTVGLVGPSGTGKTTACAALGATYGYVTDEALAVRSDGSVSAYPKPLSVQVDHMPFKEQWAADDLGLVPTPASPTLAGIAVLDRDGADRPWVEEVRTVRALAMLASETSYLSRVPQPLHRLAAIVESVGSLKVVHYAEADQLRPVVASMLSDAS